MGGCVSRQRCARPLRRNRCARCSCRLPTLVAAAAFSASGCARPVRPLPPPNPSLLAVGSESRSRDGNVTGSINDGEPATFVVTFEGQPAKEDWFAVTLDRPAAVRRVVFTQGRLFHDGGWFDTSAGKPRVQVQRQRGGAWETVGTLADYPATTASSSAGLKEGQVFTLTLKESVEVLGVRVLGQPAHGDNPQQAFSACAELEAF
jgi:hypothetical protein